MMDIDIRTYIESNYSKIGLSKYSIYSEFPIYKDLDQKTVVIPLALLSENHGIVVIFTALERTASAFDSKSEYYKDNLDEIYRLLFSKLVKNPILNQGRNNLLIPITTVIYIPFISGSYHVDGDIYYVYNTAQVSSLFQELSHSALDHEIYEEARATIEGAKGILLPRKRQIENPNTKGYAANLLEKEISQFDAEQKSTNFSDITGISRIRGLAGSGKTVILCMKAALLHLQHPEAIIVFTFYTKSLYQHVRRLITRFYRQFDDKDPDWERLFVMHAWGTSTQMGVYRSACERYGIIPLTYNSAIGKGKQPFDYVCEDALGKMPSTVEPFIDYMLIDEGQDFPPSFLKLCAKIVRESKFVYAYDDLQTIFQRKAPDAKDIFGEDEAGRPNYSFSFDKILYKCYRNPLPIIVTAHAVGFGIYANKIAQMIESDYWQDIGYEIQQGNFNPGDDMIITRPKDYSQTTLTNRYDIDQLILVEVFDDFRSETDFVCKKISEDVENQALRPDDILVISVDDRNASAYLREIEDKLLNEYNIQSNNIHADPFSVLDFQIENKVTLSTVYKAKGNESYSVYIVGIDALYPNDNNIRERNILFTAMTRSKGWLTITGIGEHATIWKKEIDKAKKNCPSLKFKYPTQKELKIMTRDMDEATSIMNKRDKLAEDLLKTMGPEQAITYIKQKATTKKGNER